MNVMQYRVLKICLENGLLGFDFQRVFENLRSELKKKSNGLYHIFSIFCICELSGFENLTTYF